MDMQDEAINLQEANQADIKPKGRRRQWEERKRLINHP